MILNAIDAYIGDFSISDLAQACPVVSRDMLKHQLFKMRDEGIIEATGKGRYARWRKVVNKE